jgi:hypothetical protein
MSRGPHPDDSRIFSKDSIGRLRCAVEEVSWLLGREYSPESAIAAVGNHHQLELRQRVAVSHSASSDKAKQDRLSRCRSAIQAQGCELQIDGFNLIIALEVALCGGVLVRGREGALRDLAGLRGSYRVIDKTDASLNLLGTFLEKHKPSKLLFLLDQSVSNSARLKSLVLQKAKEWSFLVEAQLVPDPDPILAQRSWIVSGDAMILHKCGLWVNLASEIIAELVPSAWIVDLSV